MRYLVFTFLSVLILAFSTFFTGCGSKKPADTITSKTVMKVVAKNDNDIVYFVCHEYRGYLIYRGYKKGDMVPTGNSCDD